MKDKIYSFNTNDAIKYGVDAAILLHNFRYWLDYSKAHDENEHDGYYWLYATSKGLSELFSFWSSNKIQKTLKRLEDAGAIICGEFNSNKFNRTKWYTMDGYQSQPNGGLRASQKADSTFSQTADSPYVQYKDSNTNSNTLARFDEFWSLYAKSRAKEKCIKKFEKLSDSDIDAIFKTLPAYIESTPDKKYRKDPLTWLNGRGWEDEIIKGDINEANRQTITYSNSTPETAADRFKARMRSEGYDI